MRELSVLVIATALAGCYGEVVTDGSSASSLSDAPLCAPLTDALVSDAGDVVGSVAVSNDHVGLDFALATTLAMSNVRVYAGVPPSEGGPVPFGWSDAVMGYDLIMDNANVAVDPAATSASVHLDWASLTTACGARVKFLVKVTFADGTVAWAHSATPFQSYENVYWDYYTACAETCEPPPDDGCTLTQGFWKTHPEAWPVTSLTLGSVSYSQAQLLAFFATKPRGDASIILVHQLIAAKLNVAAGGAAPGTTIAEADAWIAAHQAAGYSLPFGSAPRNNATAIALATTLDDYNNGRLGTPHCD